MELEYTDYYLEEIIIEWYTDGSIINTAAGDGKKKNQMCSCMNVLHTEISRLDIILERNTQKCDIYSDSQAAINALNSYVIYSKLISKCRRKRNAAVKKNNVS